MTRAGLDAGAAQSWSARGRRALAAVARALRHALRPGPHAPADDRARLAATRRFASIHVVGTNGKSSTVRMIAALLQHHGVRAGAYLSPHLVSFAERIRVDGDDISAAAVRGRRRPRAPRGASSSTARSTADDRVTQFEALTAAAYAQLAAAGRRGGRRRGRARRALGRDERHRRRGRRADERRPRAHALARADRAGHRAREARRRRARRDARARGRPASRRRRARRSSSPSARARRSCARPPSRRAAARRAARPRRLPAAQLRRRLRRRARPTSAAWTTRAVRAAAASTVVPGRFEVVARRATAAAEVVLDGAHNAGGIAALAESLPELPRRPAARRRRCRCSTTRTPPRCSRTLLPLCAGAVFTANANPRALSPATLALARRPGRRAGASRRVEADPRARRRARRRAAPGAGGVVLATGSIYLVADLMRPDGAGRGSTL